MELISIIILFLAYVFAFSYGTVIGGAGLITTPSLIAFGLPPYIAIGTGRTAGLGSRAVSIYKFHKNKLIDWKRGVKIGIVGIAGFTLGLFIFFKIPEEAFKTIIAIISIIGLIFIFKNKKGLEEIEVTRKEKNIGYLAVFIIATYSAIYGAMYSVFLTYTLIGFFGQSFLKAIGTRKVFSLIRYFYTVPVLMYAGKVDLYIAVILMIATAIGGYIGSHYAPKIGNEKIRWLFALVTLIAVIMMFV